MIIIMISTIIIYDDPFSYYEIVTQLYQYECYMFYQYHDTTNQLNIRKQIYPISYS